MSFLPIMLIDSDRTNIAWNAVYFKIESCTPSISSIIKNWILL